MKKIFRISLIFMVLLSLIACSKKPAEIKINLNSTVFSTLYNGPGTNIADSKIAKMNAQESESLKEALNITKWIVSDASFKTKTEPVLILEDDLGHLFSFYQEKDYSLIEVSKDQLKSVYFKSDLHLSTLLTQTVSALISNAQLKSAIKSYFYGSVVPDVNNQGCYRNLSFTKPSSDQLIDVMKVDSWILSDTKTTEPGTYELILGFNSLLELYFHQGESEATVTVVHNRDHLYVYTISQQVYADVMSKMDQLMTENYSAPGSVVTDAVYTKAQIFTLQSLMDLPKPVTIALSDIDSAWAHDYMNIETWIKLDSSVKIDENDTKLILTDKQGTTTSIGLASNCPIAVVTKDSDSQFKEVYGLVKGANGIVWAFSHAWNEAKPTADILKFSPTTLNILTGYSDLGDPLHRTLTLTVQQQANLLSTLKIEQWRKEPNTTQYGFGWDASYSFVDEKGNYFYVFDDFVKDSMLISVRGPITRSDESVYYLMSRETFAELKTSIDQMFPQ